jgi:hypothetical protein
MLDLSGLRVAAVHGARHPVIAVDGFPSDASASNATLDPVTGVLIAALRVPTAGARISPEPAAIEPGPCVPNATVARTKPSVASAGVAELLATESTRRVRTEFANATGRLDRTARQSEREAKEQPNAPRRGELRTDQ